MKKKSVFQVFPSQTSQTEICSDLKKSGIPVSKLSLKNLGKFCFRSLLSERDNLDLDRFDLDFWSLHTSMRKNFASLHLFKRIGNWIFSFNTITRITHQDQRYKIRNSCLFTVLPFSEVYGAHIEFLFSLKKGGVTACPRCGAMVSG